MMARASAVSIVAARETGQQSAPVDQTASAPRNAASETKQTDIVTAQL